MAGGGLCGDGYISRAEERADNINFLFTVVLPLAVVFILIGLLMPKSDVEDQPGPNCIIVVEKGDEVPDNTECDILIRGTGK